jgi:hypothetical protein
LALARGLLLQPVMVLHRRLPLLLALATVALVHTSGVARADDPQDAPPPPRRYHAPPPQPVYLAPLSQRTQTTYVPQSVALSGPAQLAALDDSRRPPAGYTPVLRKRTGLMIGGGVALGAAYLYSTLLAAGYEDSGRNQSGAAWVPLVGPLAQISQTGSAFDKVCLLGLGGAQVVGAILLYTGLTTEKRVFVRNDLVDRVSVAPMLGQGSSGMAVSGSF